MGTCGGEPSLCLRRRNGEAGYAGLGPAGLSHSGRPAAQGLLAVWDPVMPGEEGRWRVVQSARASKAGGEGGASV